MPLDVSCSRVCLVVKMMMYQHVDAPYYDEEMDVDGEGFYDEDSHLHTTRAYRWVRPGYGNTLLSSLKNSIFECRASWWEEN